MWLPPKCLIFFLMEKCHDLGVPPWLWKTPWLALCHRILPEIKHPASWGYLHGRGKLQIWVLNVWAMFLTLGPCDLEWWISISFMNFGMVLPTISSRLSLWNTPWENYLILNRCVWDPLWPGLWTGFSHLNHCVSLFLPMESNMYKSRWKSVHRHVMTTFSEWDWVIHIP